MSESSVCFATTAVRKAPYLDLSPETVSGLNLELLVCDLRGLTQ